MLDSGQVSFLYLWLSSFPKTIFFWRDCPFSIVCSSLLCHRLIVHICVGLFLGSQFCSIDLCVCFFVPIPNSFDHYIFVVYLKSETEMPSALFFFLKIVLTIQGHLWLHTNFSNICPSSVKYAIGILISISLNV